MTDKTKKIIKWVCLSIVIISFMLISGCVYLFNKIATRHGYTVQDKKNMIKSSIIDSGLEGNIMNNLIEFKSTIGSIFLDGTLYAKYKFQDKSTATFCQDKNDSQYWHALPIDEKIKNIINSHNAVVNYVSGEISNETYPLPISTAINGCYYYKQLNNSEKLTDIRVIIIDDDKKELYLFESRY